MRTNVKMIDRHLKNSRGSLLISVLIFMGLISIIFTSIWQIISNKQNQWAKTKILNSRDLTVTTALRNSRVASFYYKAIVQNDPGNAQLIACLLDEGAPNDCVASTQFDMHLIDESSITIVGRQSSPVLYDVYGQRCATAGPNCPFVVFSKFTALCPGATATCNQAATIQVTVFVNIHAMYSSLFPGANATSTTQTVAISDFQNYFYPVLPPQTPFGAPISDGAGPDGFITVQVYGASASPSPTPSPGPAPPPSPVSPCGAGQGAQSDGTCQSFNF